MNRQPRHLFALTLIFIFFSLPAHAITDKPVFPGRIAYIGDDFNIYTADATTTTPLTSDGQRSNAYQWPTWGRDGRLAFFCCDIGTAATARTTTWISNDGSSAPREVLVTDAQSVLYANWSPAPCDPTGACRDLSILVNDLLGNGLKVQLIRDTGSQVVTTDVAEGSPFYTTFNGDGTELLMHRNASAVSAYNIETQTIKTLCQTAGNFQTAAFAPSGSDYVYAELFAQNEPRLVLDTLEAPCTNSDDDFFAALPAATVSFTWSPDGSLIAYRTSTRDSLSGITVINPRTREIMLQSTLEDVFAFFWAPDSSKIALLRFASTEGFTQQNSAQTLVRLQDTTPRVAWTLLDIASGDTHVFSSWVPNYEMVYLVNYFDQFAVSHAVWSPDSRYLVYSDIPVQSSTSAIRILDTEGDGTPYTLANGSFGVWSWQ